MDWWKTRRWLPAAVCAVLVFIALVYIYTSDVTAVAPYKMSTRIQTATATVTVTAVSTATAAAKEEYYAPTDSATKPNYTNEEPDPNREYRKAIIVASMKSENTSWVTEQLRDVEPYVYIVNDEHANLTVPKNWGNELMPYLTFIIDHYEDLPDIMIFVHAHEYTHHNPGIFGHSTPAMVNALNSQRVIREGYMNLNCGEWRKAGHCPAMIRPVEELPNKFYKEAWEELWPEYPVPDVLSQSCCAQFATSRDRVRQVPLTKWNHFRDWLLSIDEGNPGYVWEYMWQFVLGGEHVYCPAPHVCFCDGYGMCFGGEEKFQDYIKLQNARNTMRENIHAIDIASEDQRSSYDDERRLNMIAVRDDLDSELQRLKDEAARRGKDPKLRAKELRELR